MVYSGNQREKQKMEKFQILKKEIDGICSRKFYSKGVQIVLKFNNSNQTSEENSQSIAIPYLDIILYSGQTSSSYQQQSYQSTFVSNTNQQPVYYNQPQMMYQQKEIGNINQYIQVPEHQSQTTMYYQNLNDDQKN